MSRLINPEVDITFNTNRALHNFIHS